MPRYMAEELKALLALAKKQNRASRIPATAS
jgi:hypothetical protein